MIHSSNAPSPTKPHKKSKPIQKENKLLRGNPEKSSIFLSLSHPKQKIIKNYKQNPFISSVMTLSPLPFPQIQSILQQNTKKCLKLNSCFLCKNLRERETYHSNSKISPKIHKNKFLTETPTTRHQLSQKERQNHYHKLHQKHLLYLIPIPVSTLPWCTAHNSNSKTPSSKNNQDTIRTSSTTPQNKPHKVDPTSTVKE
jgi:hypothetical protein